MTQITRYTLIYIAGVFSSALLITLFAFTRPEMPAPQQGGNDRIADTVANSLLKQYLRTADIPAEPVKGIFIDPQQLQAMNDLKREASDLAGFRVYFGLDKSGNRVGIVVAVNKEMKDLVKGSIYKTLSPGTGPCPTVCDNASTITRN